MKKLTGFLIIIFLAGFGLSSMAQSFKADDVLGIWFNEEKDAKIEIYKEGNQYYGKIVWLDEPIDPETGKPKVDDENPKEELQSRPIMGLLLVKDFEWDGELWDDGEIYDPKSGNTYDCYMKMESMDKLKVRGYIGISLLGRTTYWTRTTL